MTRSYYDTLGVDKNATNQQIKDAYIKKSLENHPSKHNGEVPSYKNFREI